jgi:hypothetical protein
MTTTALAHRPSKGTRTVGYLVAAVINSVVLYLANIEPGWQAVPFLTDETRQVLGLFNVSLAAGLAVNLGYVAYDPPWFKGLGDLLTTSISLAVLARMWDVFPFTFPITGPDWALVTRIVLIVSIVGTSLAIMVQLGLLLRRLIIHAPGAHTGAA